MDFVSKTLKHPWSIAVWMFIKGHPLLWFVLLMVLIFILFCGWLANFIPQIDVLKSKILLPLSRFLRNRRLAKNAIKSDIRGHVNREIAKLRSYLPSGWAGEMDVDWVQIEEPASLIDDDRIIVRIRPVENQDLNFINAAYHYLRTSFFPKTQLVIPKQHYEASVLYICRKVAESRSKESKIVFEDQILEPAIQRYGQIANNLTDYGHLDSRGFFTGTFLRELHLVACEARFTSIRGHMGQETKGIIKHIKDFIAAYDLMDMPPDTWFNDGNISKYAILLVANPVKTSYGIDAYINRARSQFQVGAKRLYVFGSNSESKFANAVIAGIEGSIEGIKLIERFQTPFDYRGQKDGVGAVFEIDSLPS